MLPRERGELLALEGLDADHVEVGRGFAEVPAELVVQVRLRQQQRGHRRERDAERHHPHPQLQRDARDVAQRQPHRERTPGHAPGARRQDARERREQGERGHDADDGPVEDPLVGRRGEQERDEQRGDDHRAGPGPGRHRRRLVGGRDGGRVEQQGGVGQREPVERREGEHQRAHQRVEDGGPDGRGPGDGPHLDRQVFREQRHQEVGGAHADQRAGQRAQDADRADLDEVRPAHQAGGGAECLEHRDGGDARAKERADGVADADAGDQDGAERREREERLQARDHPGEVVQRRLVGLDLPAGVRERLAQRLAPGAAVGPVGEQHPHPPAHDAARPLQVARPPRRRGDEQRRGVDPDPEVRVRLARDERRDNQVGGPDREPGADIEPEELAKVGGDHRRERPAVLRLQHGRRVRPLLELQRPEQGVAVIDRLEVHQLLALRRAGDHARRGHVRVCRRVPAEPFQLLVAVPARHQLELHVAPDQRLGVVVDRRPQRVRHAQHHRQDRHRERHRAPGDHKRARAAAALAPGERPGERGVRRH